MGAKDSDKTMAVRSEVVLRDLENLLRKGLGDSLILDSFTTSSLVGLGENYGSTILKVDSAVRRKGQISEPEKLSLVAKMVPQTQFQKQTFNSVFTFGKEIYMFTDIVPAYKAIEVESGIQESEVSDPLPKVYGARLTLKEGSTELDEDGVILMQNLKVKDYYCGNRRTGLDMKHAKMVVETLARFHVDGIAVKLKKPELFNEFKIQAKPLVVPPQMINPLKRFLFQSVKKIPVLLPHISRLEREFLTVDKKDGFAFKPPTEPWGTIIHTDLWVNNIMFRDDEFGNPEDVKLIDFQSYTYQNPLQDLIFFLFTSCREDVRATQIHDLIDLYYNVFVSHLVKLKCDLSLFSRECFDEQLRDAAKLEFVHCTFMSWILVAQVDNESKPESVNPFAVEPSIEYLERLTEISLRFIKENWI